MHVPILGHHLLPFLCIYVNDTHQKELSIWNQHLRLSHSSASKELCLREVAPLASVPSPGNGAPGTAFLVLEGVNGK